MYKFRLSGKREGKATPLSSFTFFLPHSLKIKMLKWGWKGVSLDLHTMLKVKGTTYVGIVAY